MTKRNGSSEKLTVSEIAQELGVSKTTVSRALSGKGRIGEETRARVFDYINRSGAEVSVQIHPAEQRLTHNLAMVIPSHFVQLDLPFLRKSMGGICRMAAQRGYDVLLCYADETHTDQLERQLAAHKVDGVILSRTLSYDPCMALLQRYHIPFVAMGHLEDETALQVDNDQATAAAEMTRLLLQLGMRRIAYLGGSSNYTVNRDRLMGYLRALDAFGVAAEHDLIYSGIETEEKRLDVLDKVLEHQPECLLCCDDSLAFSVLKDLRQRGIRVPEQIRLASLYDSEILLDTAPTISAVQFDAAALGTAACRLLLDAMQGKEVIPRQIQGYQVILRESTK